MEGVKKDYAFNIFFVNVGKSEYSFHGAAILHASNPSSMSVPSTHDAEILFIENLKSGERKYVYNVHIEPVKYVLRKTAWFLSHDSAFSTGVFPDEMKLATFVIIFK